MKVLYGINAGNAESAVHRADMFDARAARNLNRVLPPHFHTIVLRIASGDRDGVRPDVDLDGNPLKIGPLVFRGLYGVDFNLVAVPAFHLHASVDVLQLQGTAGLQWIRLIELLADGETGNGPNNG